MTGSEAAETSTAEDHLPKSAAASLRDKIVERRRVKAKKKLQRKLFVCLFICLFVCLFICFFFSFIHSFVYNSGAKVAAVVMKLTEYVGNGYEMMLFNFRQNLAKK